VERGPYFTLEGQITASELGEGKRNPIIHGEEKNLKGNMLIRKTACRGGTGSSDGMQRGGGVTKVGDKKGRAGKTKSNYVCEILSLHEIFNVCVKGHERDPEV